MSKVTCSARTLHRMTTSVLVGTLSSFAATRGLL